MKLRIAAAATLLTGLSTAPAHGDAGPKIAPGWYLPFGVSTGVAIHKDHSDGLYLGFEASLVNIDDTSLDWFGFYGDAIRDFAIDANRFSIGPELGMGPFGIDAGYLFENGDNLNRHGVVIRPMLTLSLLAVTGRVGQLFGDQAETFGEVGVLFKFPIEVAVDHTPAWYRRRGPLPAEDAPPPASEAPPPEPPPPVNGPFAEPPPK
jgi:hypothetical protein